MGRAPCCDKANVKKGPWSPEEDATLKSYIEQHGPVGNWIALPQKIGLKRCGKSCRLRWLNYLRPNIKHGGFSEEEDKIICSLYISIGSRWSIIAAQLPGRTDNDIKNYWNTKLKKKLLGKQRNKERHVRRDGSKRGSTKMLPETDNPSVISGTTAIDWSYVRQGEVKNIQSIAITNQNPNLISDQASISELLIHLGGALSLTQEQKPVPENAYSFPNPNDMILPSSYYNPFGKSTMIMTSSISHNSQSILNDTVLQNFPISEEFVGYRGPDDLLDVPNTSNFHHDGATYDTENGSACSNNNNINSLSDNISEGRPGDVVWEDISCLLGGNYNANYCPPLLCDYEAYSYNYNSQSTTLLGGGRGTGDSAFEESRLYVGHC